ncbi:MAG: hypothetical protein AB7E05_07315 [Sphingobium sp.]
MSKWLTADWFRRFLAGFAVGLVATLALSSGGVRAGTGAPSLMVTQGVVAQGSMDQGAMTID